MTDLSTLSTLALLKVEAQTAFRQTRTRDEEVEREDDLAKLRAEMRVRGLIKGGAVSG
jgi:hypothetical protein